MSKRSLVGLALLLCGIYGFGWMMAHPPKMTATPARAVWPAQPVAFDSVGLDMMAQQFAKDPNNPFAVIADKTACRNAIEQGMNNRKRWPAMTPEMRDNIIRSTCEKE